MSVRLNHTIVHAKDQQESAIFFSEILGLDPPVPISHFLSVELDNGVTLDFMESAPGFDTQHYAFLVDEAEFDAIFGRILLRSIPYWADPLHRIPKEINTEDGGRGVYFEDPSGHNLEMITKPYGSDS